MLTIIIFGLCFLVLIAAITAAAETAYTSINFIKLKSISKTTGHRARQARTVIKLYKNFNVTLSTILIVSNTVNIAASALATFLLTKLINDSGLAAGIATLIMAPIIIILGEIIPKTIAKKHAINYSLFLSRTLRVLNAIFYPITYFVKNNNYQNRPTITENEIIDLIDTAEKEGILEREESILASNALKFDSVNLKPVMSDLKHLIFMNQTTTFKEAIAIFKEFGYTRMPVLKEKNNFNSARIINYKLILSNYKDDDTLILPQTYGLIRLSVKLTLNKALQELQSQKQHFALVTKGKTVIGFITLEDIVEFLVGKIYDESDETGLIRELGNHKWIVSGTANIKTLFHIYFQFSPLPTGLTSSITVSSWFKEAFQIKKIKKGLEREWQNYRFKVKKIKNKKITFLVEELTKKIKKGK